MTESASGFELFIKSPEGFEMAYRVNLADIPGTATMTDTLIATCAALKEAGFERSERLDKPARGGGGGSWGQPKPEIPAPDERVPEHCGQPMKYVKFTDKNQKEREKYECRKGKECSAANQYGGHTIWRDQWVKQMGNGVQDDNPFHDDPIKSLV